MPDDAEGPDEYEVVDHDTLSVDVDREGVCRVLGVPRDAVLAIPVVAFERMLTEVYGEGLSRRPMDLDEEG